VRLTGPKRSSTTLMLTNSAAIRSYKAVPEAQRRPKKMMSTSVLTSGRPLVTCRLPRRALAVASTPSKQLWRLVRIRLIVRSLLDWCAGDRNLIPDLCRRFPVQHLHYEQFVRPADKWRPYSQNQSHEWVD